MKRKPESWHAENDPATALSSRTQSASAGPEWFTSTIGSTSRRVMFSISRPDPGRSSSLIAVVSCGHQVRQDRHEPLNARPLRSRSESSRNSYLAPLDHFACAPIHPLYG